MTAQQTPKTIPRIPMRAVYMPNHVRIVGELSGTRFLCEKCHKTTVLHPGDSILTMMRTQVHPYTAIHFFAIEHAHGHDVWNPPVLSLEDL